MTSSGSGGNPLTTIFTPPPGCFNPIEISSYLGSITSFVPTSLCSGESCFLPQDQSCYPPGAATSTTYLDGQLIVAGFSYSPGVLPHSFTSVYSSASANGQTEIWGCYSGWSLLSNRCFTVAGTVPYGSSYMTSSTYGHYGSQYYGPTTTALVPRIVVKWHRADLDVFTPASAPARLTPGMAYQTPSTSSVPKHSGLSTGAEAGIGVGVGIVSLLLVLLGFVVLQRRKKRRRTQAGWIQPDDADKPPPYSESYDMPELPGDRLAELPAADRQELDADREPREVTGVRDPGELPVHEAPREVTGVREPAELTVTERSQEIAGQSDKRE